MPGGGPGGENVPGRGETGFKSRVVAEAEIEKARGKKAKILSLYRAGTRPAGIANNLKLGTAAVRVVLSENGHPDEAPAPEVAPSAVVETPTAPDAVQDPPREREDDDGAEEGGDSENGEDTAEDTGEEEERRPPAGGRRHAEPPARDPAEEEGRSPSTPTTAAPFTSGGSGGKPRPSPLDGAYENYSLYDVLWEIMLEFGIPDARAKGLCRRFRFKDINDYAALEQIMAEGGILKTAIQSVVGAYRETTKIGRTAPSVTDPDAPPGTGPTNEELRRRIAKRLGHSISPDDMSPEEEERVQLLRLDRLTREAGIRKMNAEAAALDRASGREGVAGDPEDTVEIAVNVTGYPEMRRVKVRELSMWAPYRVPPPGQQGPAGQSKPDEIPVWAKPLFEANARQAEEDRLKRVVESTMAPYKPALERLNQPPAQSGPSPREQALEGRLNSLVDETRKEREERLRSETDQLKRDYNRLGEELRMSQSPEGQLRLKAQMEEIARKAGFVPRGEALADSREAIDIQRERDAARTEAEARSALTTALTEKVKKTGGLKDGLIEEGLPKLALDILRDAAGSPSRDGTDTMEPTDEQLAAQVDEMERSGGPGPAAPADGGEDDAGGDAGGEGEEEEDLQPPPGQRGGGGRNNESPARPKVRPLKGRSG